MVDSVATEQNTLQHRVPAAAIATGVGYDVSTLLSVPTDSLKRVTRERKYAIDEVGKCLEDASSDVERLKSIRERFQETYAREQMCIRKLQARVEYIKENVLETARESRVRGSSRGGSGTHRQTTTNRNMATNGRTIDAHNARTETIPYVDVLIQEYVARQGYTQTLQTLQEPHPEFLPLLIDVEQYEELNRLVVSIEERHSCTEVLAWCARNAAKLKKMRSGLVFQLHVQEFVQMLDGDSAEGSLSTETTDSLLTRKHRAMAYAKKHLSPYAEVYPAEFQRAAGLLVLRDILPESSSCVELFAARRWHDISALLRRDYFRIHGLSLTSSLETHLSCGIAALQVSGREDAVVGGVACGGGAVFANGSAAARAPNTTAASSQPSQSMDADIDIEIDIETPPTTSNQPLPQQNIMHGRVNQQNDDPLRHPVIQKLAATVPFSKRTVSKLVCPVTGIVMEGNNQPVVLPNGYVYGSLAVYEGLLSDWNDADNAGDAGAGDDGPSRSTRIQCPCTGDTFSMDQVRKLFIV